jgi:hypothetical protein
LSPLFLTERASEYSVTKHALRPWHFFEIIKHIVDAFGEFVTERSPIVAAHGMMLSKILSRATGLVCQDGMHLGDVY